MNKKWITEKTKDSGASGNKLNSTIHLSPIVLLESDQFNVIGVNAEAYSGIWSFALPIYIYIIVGYRLLGIIYIDLFICNLDSIDRLSAFEISS